MLKKFLYKQVSNYIKITANISVYCIKQEALKIMDEEVIYCK